MFKFYQQLDSNDCGLACIRMIARYFDIHIGYSKLRKHCELNRLGTSISDICTALERLNLSPHPLKLYKNPEILFLDEATSSLDANNEAAIVERINDFSKSITLIVAAHRLSTVRHADLIIFLKDGQIAEMGTHESLIEQQGEYYQLVQNQLELTEA